MIDVTIIDRVTSYRLKLFYDTPLIIDSFRFVQYNAAINTEGIFGFKRYGFFTKLIDLTISPEGLLLQCRKNTKYEIKRAEKEGIRFEIESNPDFFIKFYLSFASSKSTAKEIVEGGIDDIPIYKGNLVITKAVFDNEVLVMHSYVVDKECRRVRLLHTASLFRDVDNVQRRNLTGRANRFLHFQDMLYFKENGFDIYDMGGYAYNTDDEELKRINEFKDSFGGEVAEESIYISFPLYLLRKAVEKAKLFKKWM
ncbi:MAG: hypothetical protein HY808_01295 [Nitrospirae bacterium]|nr:hypothetical protein [Nitrospirota bacterium]